VEPPRRARQGPRPALLLHNHFQEWLSCPDNPLKRGEDILLAETDPKLVFFEMDIYWAYVGQWQSGQVVKFDPLYDYAIPYRNRYVLFHVKDGKPDQSGGFTIAPGLGFGGLS
jgi:sugar phosphate isomerase/epimerase